jgi:hypothetical protein
MNSLLLGLVALEWRGRSAVVWVDVAYDAAKALAALGLGAAALACLWPRWARRLRIGGPEGDGPVPEALKTPALLAAMAVLMVLKTAQYLSLQGSNDASVYLSMIWNAFKGGFLPSSVHGDQLAFRFTPIIALYAPLRLLAASPLFFICLHAALVFSSLAVLWRLGRVLRIPEVPRWLLCLLLACNPFFQLCLATWLFPETLAVPLFLACLICWERRNWGSFALCAALLLGVKEEAPVALFALGLGSLAVADRRRDGGVLMAASAASFLAIAQTRALLTHGRSNEEWGYFGWGRGAGESLVFVLRHPGAAFMQWAWPPRRFAPMLEFLAGGGGLAVLYPPALIGVLALGAPHQAVVDVNSGFHRLDSNYSSFLLPLMFWGASRALLRLWAKPAWRPRAAALLLACSAAGLWRATTYVGFIKVSGETLRSGWSEILAVRPEESLWTAQAFAPALAFRRALHAVDDAGSLAAARADFVPDAILLIKSRLDSGAVAELTGFLRGNRYTVAREDRDLVLLRRAAP